VLLAVTSSTWLAKKLDWNPSLYHGWISTCFLSPSVFLGVWPEQAEPSTRVVTALSGVHCAFILRKAFHSINSHHPALTFSAAWLL
jgi:hypothetical protein